MITCITLATMQTLPQLKAHAGAALNVGVTPEELREVMYLTAPFIGFPKMLNAVATVNEVFKERGISLPLEKQGTVTEETRHKTGKAIQDKLYPGGIASVMEGMPGNMGKDVEQFLTDYFFGEIYSRGALDLQTRELLGYCVLTTLEAESQLHSHYHGNINAGNSPETLTAAVIQCLPYIGFPAAIKALRIIKEETADADGKAAFQREGRFPAGNDIPHRRTEHRIRQVFHRQQLSGSHIQGADTVQQCHFRAGLPQQLAHSPCHQRRRADAGLRGGQGLVSGMGKACDADASGRCHPHPGECEALAWSGGGQLVCTSRL